MKIVIIDYYEQGCGRRINIVSKFNDDFINEIDSYFLMGAYVYDTDIFDKSKKNIRKSLPEKEKVEFKIAKKTLKDHVPQIYKYLKNGLKVEFNYLIKINFS